MAQQMEQVDIIVGIPSYNEADNIAFVAEQADKGLRKYFGDKKAAIINCDNNSPDGTKDVFLKSKTETPKIYISTPEGVKGKGNNFRNLFKAAKKLNAKAVVVVDADLKSITPEWIEYLGKPIYEGYDYVTPVYSRHKYDGTITNNLVYPLIYGLMGKNLRQPIGGEFAFSGALAHHWLDQDWHDTTRQYGIDNFMTTHAVFGDFKICQAGLGAKIHKPSAPKLNEMFIQVVTTLFDSMLKNKHKWIDADKLEETALYGLQDLAEPQDLQVNTEEMKKTATYEFFKNMDILKKNLSPENFEMVYQAIKHQTYAIDARTWAKLVYDLLHRYSECSDKESLIESIKPLYFARVVSFVNQTLEYEHEKAENEIRLQAEYFKEMKPYLLQKLSSPEAVTNVLLKE